MAKALQDAPDLGFLDAAEMDEPSPLLRDQISQLLQSSVALRDPNEIHISDNDSDDEGAWIRDMTKREYEVQKREDAVKKGEYVMWKLVEEKQEALSRRKKELSKKVATARKRFEGWERDLKKREDGITGESHHGRAFLSKGIDHRNDYASGFVATTMERRDQLLHEYDLAGDWLLTPGAAFSGRKKKGKRPFERRNATVEQGYKPRTRTNARATGVLGRGMTREVVSKKHANPSVTSGPSKKKRQETKPEATDLQTQASKVDLFEATTGKPWWNDPNTFADSTTQWWNRNMADSDLEYSSSGKEEDDILLDRSALRQRGEELAQREESLNQREENMDDREKEQNKRQIRQDKLHDEQNKRAAELKEQADKLKALETDFGRLTLRKTMWRKTSEEVAKRVFKHARKTLRSTKRETYFIRMRHGSGQLRDVAFDISGSAA